MKYLEMSKAELETELAREKAIYDSFLARKLKLNMARGKPDEDQLDISVNMYSGVPSPISEDGTDCRNYGLLDGITEAKKLFADILEAPAENVIVCGNSSLNLMFDTVARSMIFGSYKGATPWMKQERIKFLCPVPGYDRHFAITETFGIEMINIPMTPEGPDMDLVERYVESDPAVKGIWCVPKYSNPDGYTYSDETVRRFARLRPAADDFRIFWDNAYVVHDLYDDADKLLSIYDEAKAVGNENIFIMFASTSKITFPGSGISAIVSGKENIDFIKSIMTVQTIGYDKMNMLRHVNFLRNIDGVRAHMKRHADILRPKFETVLTAFENELSDLPNTSWTNPKGGYFITLYLDSFCASRTFELCKSAGVTLTNAGATFPYGKDPEDRVLRIAPTFPPVDELKLAVSVLVCSAKIATIEKLLK
ncbi:MAG: aminotransferase [Clostridia bacterium]|nr:aminotransferase [Clostridia bacterium]